ncbi:MAG: GDP-mannose 4,6-dehydratase [Thermococcus sp.]|nr:GDP-mannose 4,6-dehydratase [Thermococcus sp.]
MTNVRQAFITGIAGFAGSYLAEFLLARGYRVSGTILDRDKLSNIRHIAHSLQLYECDIRDAGRLLGVMSRAHADEIYHLAALVHIPTAHANPRLTLEVNVLGTLNLLEAVRECCPRSRVLCVGSAGEYGQIQEGGLPISEAAPVRPVDPYGVSKASAGMLAYQYYKSFGMSIVQARAFNHIGPRQSPDFAIPSFAKQIAEIEVGISPPKISVGDLSAKRDFTDVRDVVNAYWRLVQRGVPGEVYNICSGRAVAIREVLERLLAMSPADVEIVKDSALLRPSDIPILVGDCSRLTAATGWAPRIPLEQTLKDVLEYWRLEVGQRKSSA